MKRKGPWKVLGSKTVYKNPWIAVHEDRVIQPDGKKGIYGFIDFKPGSTVLALDKNNRVLLLHEYHYGVGRYTYECVSGGIDRGETPLQAAKRELTEEVGLQAREWVSVGHIDPFTSNMNSKNYLWIARNFSHIKKSCEGTEVMQSQWVPLSNVYRMVLQGAITHAATVVLILRVRDLLQKKIGKKSNREP